MDRITTGSRQLDLILGGGLPANAIHIVMGGPGSGKTILAEQLAFANATRERPALYLTTVSEPLPKLLGFLQEYGFADTSKVGTEVVYGSIGEALAEHPEQLTEIVAERVEKLRPSVVVIDSFKAVADLMPDLRSWRRALDDLAGYLSSYRATTLWVGEYVAEMHARLPEFAVADGVIELSREQQGSRDFRFLRILKLRGSDFLDGLHALRIGRRGLRVFPRLRTPQIAPDYAPVEERISSGVAGLDAMIGSGLLRGSTTVLAGGSGAGKTVLAIQFLRAAALRGEPALLLTFEENPVQIARVVARLDWDGEELLASGALGVWFCSPVELQIDTIVGELFERIERDRIRVIVIDGVADLASTANDPLRLRDYLFAMVQHFAVKNVTVLLTVDNAMMGTLPLDHPGVAYLGDNLVVLETQQSEELTRTVRVMKTRGSAHDPRRRLVTIAPGGMVVA